MRVKLFFSGPLVVVHRRGELPSEVEACLVQGCLELLTGEPLRVGRPLLEVSGDVIDELLHVGVEHQRLP